MSTREPARYEIFVQGIIDERWSAWFGDLTVRMVGEDRTMIVGILPDQAALHGLLTKINSVGLALLSVQRLDDPGR